MSSVYERPVSGSIDEVGERLVRAVELHKYGVLGTIDLKEKMNGKGVEFDACFAVLVIEIDLNAGVQWFSSARALFAQTCCYLESINAVYPIEGFSNAARFIGLNGTDKMPVDLQIL